MDGMSNIKVLFLPTNKINLLNIICDFINVNIQWKNCVSICTDDTQTMSGRFHGLNMYARQKYPDCINTLLRLT